MKVHLLLLFLLGLGQVKAQSFDVAGIRTQDDKAAFFRAVRTAQQELPARTGTILLTYGYDSPEHRAHQDSTQRRDALLREVIEDYLDRHGFPQQDEAQTRLHREAQETLWHRLRAVGALDTLARDSIFREVRREYAADVFTFSFAPVVMQVLETEPDFTKRCELISLLRFEWEQGNIPLVSLLSYLRHTYQGLHGQELSIPTGTTELERLLMYARELSGCWGT